MSLSGRSVVVLGGGSGIGRAVVDSYRAAGAAITVVERSPGVAAGVARDIPAARVVVGDAADEKVIAEAVQLAAGASSELDNVTCCVGLFDHYLSLRNADPAQVATQARDIWRVNVGSVLNAAAVAWPYLRAARGSLTVTLSESAFYPLGGGPLYGSSKWALRGLVSHLSADFAPEVRVNGVAPGGTTRTEFGHGKQGDLDETARREARIAESTLLKRAARPEDHSGAYTYLADPELAGMVTGVVINTDGGRSFGERRDRG